MFYIDIICIDILRIISGCSILRVIIVWCSILREFSYTSGNILFFLTILGVDMGEKL